MVEFSLNQFDYNLPEEKIAQYPLEKRDESNLLVYHKNRTISHHKFYELPNFIPEGSLLLRNVTKVIPARIFVEKPNGGTVEVLLLSNKKQQANVFEALIKGRKIKPNVRLSKQFSKENLVLYVDVLSKNQDCYTVSLDWKEISNNSSSKLTFEEVLDRIAKTPLPPYIKREAEELDRTRYQTIYGRQPGSVAAPTAGFHFTDDVIQNLKSKSIDFADVTLHISLGTFKPIRVENIFAHNMHSEEFLVYYDNIKKIHKFFQTRGKEQLFVAIGTTSVRTLESLYWFAQDVYSNSLKPNLNNALIDQYIWRRVEEKLSIENALDFLLGLMDKEGKKEIIGNTSLYITPDYKIRFFDAIVTNFHQPKSTLLLLVYAFVGEDWKQIYNEALEKNYRFLSYGDSSLLFKTNG
ncbi:MAG: S-adenosylmethionine:tRNA ribosyltransferase-isomerase [Candidatus Kapaibacterium sp.]|nr:MAG: S-adenosylmethionine:tRNA ribosyltransferase-isomerase [Candidatus Kapabacteria bacterium]